MTARPVTLYRQFANPRVYGLILWPAAGADRASCIMKRKNTVNVKATIAAGSLALALFASTGANAAAMHHHRHRMSVEMMGHTTATLNDGTKLNVDIVKMNGHMMVAIPADELPDYLHQQIFQVQR